MPIRGMCSRWLLGMKESAVALEPFSEFRRLDLHASLASWHIKVFDCHSCS